VDAGKQGKHIEGHPNNNAANAQWRSDVDHVMETQNAWLNGTSYTNNPQHEIKHFDTGGRIIGKNGETKIRVIKDAKGTIHGYPV
jgi:hypothetical protein